MAGEWLTVLATGLVTSGGLLAQTLINRKADERRRRLELDEARRQSEVSARSDWAGALQEAVSASQRLLALLEGLESAPIEDASWIGWMRNLGDAREGAGARLASCAGRVLTGDRDLMVRKLVDILSLAAGQARPPGRSFSLIKKFVAEERVRLRDLQAAFTEFARLMAGLDFDPDMLAEKVVAGFAYVSPDARAKMIEPLKAQLRERKASARPLVEGVQPVVRGQLETERNDHG